MIIDVGENTITFDVNHRLAGEDLAFDLKPGLFTSVF